eukprot:3392640-Ditylum_brightwellii.AAC.1
MQKIAYIWSIDSGKTVHDQAKTEKKTWNVDVDEAAIIGGKSEGVVGFGGLGGTKKKRMNMEGKEPRLMQKVCKEGLRTTCLHGSLLATAWMMQLITVFSVHT